MTTELSAIDGGVRLTKTDLGFLDSVEQMISKSIIESNLSIATDFIDKMRKVAQLQGIGLAMTLSRLEEAWEPVFVPAGNDGDFYDYITDTVGYSKQTAKKYIRMWRSVFENKSIPKPIRDGLMGKGVDTLLLLTAAAQDGIFDEEDWEMVERAPNKQEVRTLVRSKRGQVSSSSTAIVITLDRDGTLKARKGTGKAVEFGWLNPSPNEVGQAAIDRIIRAAGVVER